MRLAEEGIKADKYDANVDCVRVKDESDAVAVYMVNRGAEPCISMPNTSHVNVARRCGFLM